MLGLIAIGMLGAGLVGWVTDADPGWPAILIRTAIILLAIWLAAPGFNRVPRRVAVGVATAITVVAFRPRLILAALAIGGLTMVLWRRQ